MSQTALQKARAVGGTPRNLRIQIQIAKKELGMDDFAYRALLQRIAGRSTSRSLNRSQLHEVVAEMKRLGWKPKRKASPKNPAAKKIWALWFTLSDAGEVSRKGCNAYIKRMTDKQDVNFLTNEETNRVIEALKAWIKRVDTK